MDSMVYGDLFITKKNYYKPTFLLEGILQSEKNTSYKQQTSGMFYPKSTFLHFDFLSDFTFSFQQLFRSVTEFLW